MNLLLILLVSILSCTAQLCQKQAAHLGTRQDKKPMLLWLGLSVVLLGVAMLLWLAVLSVVPVSVAYPMLSLNFVLVALAARLIWRETYSVQQWIGTLVIVAGVALMGSHL
jgi:undecaprenyl phosphate-alpha-L-ara4N flippase subunit ArnE